MILGLLAALAYLAAADAVDPHDASRIGSAIAGHPELAAEVERTCALESAGCRRIGIHRGHVPRAPAQAFERPAIRAGLIDPERCPTHAGGPPDRWGIRGAHGHAAAYAVRYLQPCAAPEALDVPLLSAIAAARRLHVLRVVYRRRTVGERRHAWRHGVGCSCEG